MPSKTDKLAERYDRIAAQLAELFSGNPDPQSRMATAAALLHHKMPHFFWTGFYRLAAGSDLIVGPYQGPLACSILERGQGVCWACAARGETIIVPNVHEFPGHIPCDSRASSEIVVPVRDAGGELVAVLDVDSTELDAFHAVDASGLERVAQLLYAGRPTTPPS